MNSTAQKVDFLILGAGLAAFCLAAELEEAGASVLLLDDGRKASSRVAGGVINPVSGKRFGIDPGFGEAKALAKRRYEKLGPVCRDIEILRLMHDDQEYSNFVKKEEVLKSGGWIRRIDKAESFARIPLHLTVPTDVPTLCISNAAVVDLAQVMSAFYQDYLQRMRLLNVSADDARTAQQLGEFQGHAVGAVISCEGWRFHENDVFSYVPTMFAKGQVLELDFRQAHGLRDIVIVHSKFLLPVNETRCLYGASYEWNDISDEESPATTEFLLEHFRKSYDAEVDLVRCRTGVRPIVKDLKPVLGEHPQRKGLFLLNGLGSKGALQAPLCAQLLARKILYDESLPAAFDLARFDALHKKPVTA